MDTSPSFHLFRGRTKQIPIESKKTRPDKKYLPALCSYQTEELQKSGCRAGNFKKQSDEMKNNNQKMCRIL